MLDFEITFSCLCSGEARELGEITHPPGIFFGYRKRQVSFEVDLIYTFSSSVEKIEYLLSHMPIDMKDSKVLPSGFDITLSDYTYNIEVDAPVYSHNSFVIKSSSIDFEPYGEFEIVRTQIDKIVRMQVDSIDNESLQDLGEESNIIDFLWCFEALKEAISKEQLEEVNKLLSSLAERFCERRALGCLFRFLPAIFAVNGLTDGWELSREALCSTRALCLSELKPDEAEDLDKAINLIDRILA